MKHTDIPNFRKNLLAHYATHARDLPWRQTHLGAYEIWISEIMLQQTTVATVVDYYMRFLHAFPTIQKLAAASEDEVFHLWQGLGYYSRARNLRTCAQVVVAQYGGAFPQTQEELIKLPGIGPYTAAAIASMAFNKPAAVVDGNVERVMARLYKVTTPIPAAKKELTALAQTVACPNNPAAYSNAIMDFGATICTPKKPLCLTCPLQKICACASPDIAVEYPKKTPKPPKPERVGEVYVLQDSAGDVLLIKRPSTGLLSGLWAFPSTGWDRADDTIPPNINWEDAGEVVHVFTHFKLTLEVRVGRIKTRHPQGFTRDNLPPMPTLMRKVLGKIT